MMPSEVIALLQNTDEELLVAGGKMKTIMDVMQLLTTVLIATVQA